MLLYNCLTETGPQNQQKKLFLRGDFRQFSNKNVHIWEVGAKRHLNGTSKVNRQTDRHTDGQTDRRTDKSTYRLNRPRGPIQWKTKGLTIWFSSPSCIALHCTEMGQMVHWHAKCDPPPSSDRMLVCLSVTLYVHPYYIFVLVLLLAICGEIRCLPYAGLFALTIYQGSFLHEQVRSKFNLKF